MRRMNPALYIAIPMLLLVAVIVTVGLGPVLMNRMRTQKIMAEGVLATAQVIELTDSGNRINQQPVARVRLTVSPPGGAPYEAVSQAIVSGINSPIYQPGKSLSVKFDPAHPDRVAILGPAP
jgi:hypothetical protein